MSDILLIGKELPDVLEFAESISLKERRIFTTSKNATEVSNFEAENIFSATWNKNSAISARSLIIKAETKLDNLDEYLFYFDAPYFASKFELDKSEEVSAAIDTMISSYQYAINELLYRLEQFKSVELDFEEVDFMGQGFADEVFRVFKTRYPELEIIPLNASPDILRMIKHVQRA